MEKFKFLTKNKITKLPKNPGVYAFFTSTSTRRQSNGGSAVAFGEYGKRGREFLYIGKAANIRERVKNHFTQPVYRNNLFINQVQNIGFIKTDSEIEALLLEAKLIKKYQPKYNIFWRDDKNFFYVGITKDKLPYLFLTHQPESKNNHVGPFIAGRPLKQTLRFLRKIFPYYTIKKHPKNPCLYCQLSLCPGPIPNIREYKKNIRNLIKTLRGKGKSVIKNLREEMKFLSLRQEFERAAKIRDQIKALENVLSHTKFIEETETPKEMPDWQNIQRILQNLLKKKKKILRIEAYDVSNIQGKQATGSMVTFVKGIPDKNFYRRFKIKIGGKPNDTAMIKETLARRLKHPEWRFPDLIFIDGGKAQLNAAQLVIHGQRLPIPVIALAKRKNELFLENKKGFILLKSLPREIFNFILQIRDEAHRFAITYHRKLRKKALLEN